MKNIFVNFFLFLYTDKTWQRLKKIIVAEKLDGKNKTVFNENKDKDTDSDEIDDDEEEDEIKELRFSCYGFPELNELNTAYRNVKYF